MKKLIFLGTNSVLMRYIEAAEELGYTIIGIVDSDWYGNRDTFDGIPIIASEKNFDKSLYADCEFFVAVNWSPVAGRDIVKRQKLIDFVYNNDLPCANLISPRANVSRTSQLGKNIFIGAFSTLEPYCRVENFVTLLDFVGIGHDSSIGENTFMQRKSGCQANIGKNCYIGMGCIIFGKNGNVTINDNAILDPALHVARDVLRNEHVTLDRQALRIYRTYNSAA